MARLDKYISVDMTVSEVGHKNLRVISGHTCTSYHKNKNINPNLYKDRDFCLLCLITSAGKHITLQMTKKYQLNNRLRETVDKKVV